MPEQTTMPVRVQRRMTKGWRKPDNTVCVSRPGPWGNPWKIGSTGWTVDPGGYINREPHPPLTAEQAVASFRNSVEADPGWMAVIRADLHGKNLACWCKPGAPCHADVLLEIANKSGEANG